MADLLPTGTVTLLLADVEGSTKLWETQPESMSTALARLNRTASALIAEHNGVRPVEQGEGDSFVAAFARAADAVACALALQRTALAPIKLRIGVHTGDVQLRDEGNYAGTTINKTARLRDLGHGGQTVLSGVTEELVEDRLPEGAWLTDLGRHTLRDVPRPVRVAQLCHPDLPQDFPPLRTTNNAVPEQLPMQLTTFIGRTSQIADIRGLLEENRLLTLTGAGGAGKTRLAVEVAGQMTDKFADGIWYADLAPVTHPEVVPVTVARTLGLPDQPGRSITDTLLGFVRDRHMLLVLDNCEHLLEAGAALVSAILGASARTTVLATSREPLMVAGEVNWQVPSLSLDDEAIDLFVDRAHRARPGFEVTGDDSTDVAEICRRLDGMPLAIELAAARVRSLTLDEILNSLHDRFRLLTGGARTAVRRQQTLRASVDWSHALLTEPERVLFRRLAVFMGGFDLEAAQAVAGTGEVERFQVLDQLSLLVDKSLVVAEDADRRTRYRLLETVRQYALEKLGESGEADKIRGRHRDHYSTLADHLDASRESGYEQRLAQAVTEFDNVRAAFAWSLESGNPAEALELASSLHPLWLTRGRISEGIAWLDTASAAGEIDPAILARAIADKAVLRSWVDVTGMYEPTMEALTIARDVDDPALLCRVLAACACITAHEADIARPYFTEAVALARELGDSWRLCQLLGRQAYGSMIDGTVATAQSLAQEGYGLAMSIGDDFNARQCLMYLAWSNMDRGYVATAVAQFQEMIEQATRAHDAMSRVAGLICSGFALAWHGNIEGARKTAADALEACTELGFLVQNAHLTVVWAELAAGNAAAAMQAAEAALESATNSAVEKANWTWSAEAALACGDLARARLWSDDAVSGTKGMFLCLALAVRVRVHLAEGNSEQAANDAYDGLAIVSSMEAHLCAPVFLECLGEIALGAESFQHAVRLLGAASALRASLELPLFKVHEECHYAVVTSLRTSMTDSEFEAAWAEGAALSIEEAIAYAQRGRGERKRPATGWASLTPTELDVVRLVAEGIPNKDIATRLFVSPRTVQSHLRHVYNKVGLTSRVQLAQEAARQMATPT
ncbi:LuxR family transcriptional regulator [Mycobacterium sp. NPDC051804]|uniref:LuxR family transcriptional regulator n=1 Tax=Mycobacterium sp. NPDC051804 TaxID=3364295 RepID=UPI00379E6658